MTLTIGADVLRAVGVRAPRLRTRTSDVIEDPVRQQLGLDLFRRLGDRGPLTEGCTFALTMPLRPRSISYARGR